MSKLLVSKLLALNSLIPESSLSKSLLLKSVPRLIASLALAGCVVTYAGVASSAAADLSVPPLLRHPPPATVTVAKPPGPPTALRPRSPTKPPARARPDPALLAEPQAPDCAFKGTWSNPPTPEETRQKLDYEAQCWRKAEGIARARLTALQDAVRQMIKGTASRDALASANE